jgi:hypothetical protein
MNLIQCLLVHLEQGRVYPAFVFVMNNNLIYCILSVLFPILNENQLRSIRFYREFFYNVADN